MLPPPRVPACMPPGRPPVIVSLTYQRALCATMERAEDRGAQDGAPRAESSLAGPESYQYSTGSGISRAGPDSTIHNTLWARRCVRLSL